MRKVRKVGGNTEGRYSIIREEGGNAGLLAGVTNLLGVKFVESQSCRRQNESVEDCQDKASSPLPWLKSGIDSDKYGNMKGPSSGTDDAKLNPTALATRVTARQPVTPEDINCGKNN